jgi:hypothetical protein
MQTILQARGDTAYTTEWDSAEQAALDSALARFPADRHPPLERYVRAAACLPKKYVYFCTIYFACMGPTVPDLLKAAEIAVCPALPVRQMHRLHIVTELLAQECEGCGVASGVAAGDGGCAQT